MKGRTNIYLIVFGVVVAIVAVAAVSTMLFSAPLNGNTSLSSLHNYGPAANFQGISAWINSKPLNITQLRGKVVLVDFWTYSCINCIRTIPFLNELQKQYGSDGLVIVGVHTPEFQFEHNLTNVQNAVKKFNITYAVALDNNYSTWDAYGNEYWPADYVVDKNGDIRYENFGEGPDDFNSLYNVIKELLANAGYNTSAASQNITDVLNFSQRISPEMYFGYQELENGRTDYFGNAGGIHPGVAYDYVPGNISSADTIYLSGDWYSAPEYLMAENNSALLLVYYAEKVNVVAGGNSTLYIYLDGKNLNSSYLGSDATLVNGTATVNVNSSRLYNLVSGPSYGEHVVEISAKPGFKIYTFTFG